jgi:cell division topological specificity factor
LAAQEERVRFFDFFNLRRPDPTADTAKERLTVLVALDRQGGGGPDFLPLLQRELLEVIRKYVEVDHDKVNVDFQSGTGFSTLEVNVELPNRVLVAKAS